ncbi:hypothetical protein G7Y79_00012g032860 [Physcia stellaris]|nr:hypothetical protein G7Y79_00012g032860 [Physcia stellaris]
MRVSTSLIASALTAVVSATTCKQQPIGNPSGNPIGLPGLAQQVQAGTPFTITWEPTTPGGVSIVLLRGPSENVLPIACITESTPNTGKFVWTPPTSLEPDVTHYGLQIIVDGTGQYQYSTQFGISNPSYNSATVHSTTTSSHTTTSTSSHTATATGTPPQTTSSTVASQISYSQVQVSTVNATTQSVTPSVVVISTLSMNATHLAGSTAAHPTIASTGAPQHNSTHLRGTKTMTVPKTLQSESANRTTKTNHVIASATGTASSPTTSSATTSSPAAVATGGASHLRAAGGLIAALATIMALVL